MRGKEVTDRMADDMETQTGATGAKTGVTGDGNGTTDEKTGVTDDETDATDEQIGGTPDGKTTDGLQAYLSKRGITAEQMDEARRRTEAMLEMGLGQTDAEVAIGILAERIGRKLSEMREAEHAGDEEAVNADWEELNHLLFLRHKVYAGDERAIGEVLGLGGADGTHPTAN